MVEQLQTGIANFQAQVFPQHRELFEQLATGQAPETLGSTCADSRIDPWMITQSKPGDIFVIRNAGNIVPILDGDGTSKDGTAASIDYAVAVLGVKHIVVCGHASCGAMAGLADLASLETLPSVARWLEHSQSLLDEDRVDVVDIDDLVHSALAAGGLTLHGWVYDIGSGDVRVLESTAA